MAKYYVKYSCGHEGEIQLFGRQEDRYRKISWLEAEGICPECYKRHQEEQRAAEHAESLKTIAECGYNLPALEGSTKQIAWAETIRGKAVVWFLGHHPEELMDKYRPALDKTIFNSSAKWWIDNREWTIKELIVKAVRG